MIVRRSSDRSPVLIRNVDNARCPVRPGVRELPARVAVRDVGDQIEWLAGVLERPLEQVVVVGADDQLKARCAALRAHHRRQLGKQPMERRRLVIVVEQIVQGAEQRACACRQRHILRDAREIAIGGRMKLVRQIGRQLSAAWQEPLFVLVPDRLVRAAAQICAGAEERHDAPFEHEIDQVGVVLLQIRVDWTAAHLSRALVLPRNEIPLKALRIWSARRCRPRR